MLRPHTLLWHYLWVGPHVLQAVLAVFLWRSRVYRRFPVFFAYLVFEAIEEFTLYGMDILPSVTVRVWWLTFCAGLIVEGTLKLGAVGELFCNLLSSRPPIARIGTRLIASVAAALFLLAIAAAAYAPMNRGQYGLTYRAHILLQSFYITEGGLALFLFLFVAYFRLTWDRKSLGIALGFGILFCEHLAAWSVMAGEALLDTHYYLLDFLNAATYHVCVLIWCAVSLPENDLAAWNREVGRLIQQ
jgi:hypothetical protein